MTPSSADFTHSHDHESGHSGHTDKIVNRHIFSTIKEELHKDHIDGIPQRHGEAPNQENTKARKEEEMGIETDPDNFVYFDSFWVKNSAQEHCFAFVDEDYAIVRALTQSLQIMLQCPGLQPEKYDSIQRAVDAVKRLPQMTPGICVTVTLSLHFLSTNRKRYYKVLIGSDRFYICSGSGFVGNLYEDTHLLIENNGYHEIDPFIIEWFPQVEEAMAMIRTPHTWHLDWSLCVEDSSAEQA